MIYICHSPNDRAIAEKVYMGLKQKELKCWISSNDIMDGQSYAEAIVNAIEKSAIMVFIYSSNSNTSPQIIHELEKAASQDKFIIPFKIDFATPSKIIEYYLSSPYKVDATNGILEDNINKLENIIKNIYQQLPDYNNNDIGTVKDTLSAPNTEINNASSINDVPNNYSQETVRINDANNEINKGTNPDPQVNQNVPYQNQIHSNVNTMNNRPNQNFSSGAQVKSAKKSKTIILVGSSVVGGIILLSIMFILTKNFLLPLIGGSVQINVPNPNPSGYNSNAKIDGSNYTEDEIIEFAKTAILELDRLESTSEFYDTYAYRGSEYDITCIYEDVLFNIMDLDVVRFEDVSIVGENRKEHGIEYLLKVNFVCYADYQTQAENDEIVHREGEALLYNNVVILETPNNGLKYLYMEGISEDELNARNEDIESSYRKIAESGNINTEDTIQSYLPDSTNGDAIMSVKDIVRNNDHKVVAVYVESENGQSQGSGFFIKDGVIVTNYHVIDGGRSAKILLSDGTYVDVAGVIFSDPNVDIAVLKLVKEIGIDPVTIGQALDSDKGSIAVAIGSPLGLFNTVSTGIISNFWQSEGVNLIQISIPITHGNSGGALFNESGKLIGITTSGMGEANLNFAISSSHIIPIYEEIKQQSFNTIKAFALGNAGNSSNSTTTHIGSSNQELLSSKYKFVNSDKPISDESTYTSDFKTIYTLSVNEYYTEEDLLGDLTFAFGQITNFGTENYGRYFDDILHDTYIKADIETYIEINNATLEVNNSTDQYIYFSADEIEIIGAGIKKDGNIDGIIVSALFSKNLEPYVRSKFYFRPNYYSWGDIDSFLYVGEVTDK